MLSLNEFYILYAGGSALLDVRKSNVIGVLILKSDIFVFI